MLFKLSLKNQKKSIKDYAIYFFTLILGVSIFYVFNAIDSQTAMMELSKTKSEIISMMNTALSMMSVVVSFILGFLIAYASQFLIKKRKKEFGLYLMLGMKKTDIFKIIFFETLVVGLVSLFVGLLIGIGLSQFMSLFVANLFEANMQRFTFTISFSAIIKTILYFVVIYIVVTIIDLIIVGKAKLIDLMTAHKKKEKRVLKNPYISVIIFIIACIMLGNAYYNVTSGMAKLATEIDVLIQIILGIIGTFLIFWSVSGFILTIIKKFPNVYHKGMNSFVASEVSSKVNSTVVSGSIICLLLFVTICLLSSAFSLKSYKETNLTYQAPISVSFSKDMTDGKSIENIFNNQNVESSIYSSCYSFYTYQADEITYGSVMKNYAKDYISKDPSMEDYFSISLPIINETVYNKVAAIYGTESIELNKDEYQIVGNSDNQMKMFNEALVDNNTITFMGENLHAKNKKIIDGYLMMSYSLDCFGFIVIPDEFDLSSLAYHSNYLLVDKLDEQTQQYIQSDDFNQLVNPDNKSWAYVRSSTQRGIYDDSIGSSGMVIFIALYLGFIFMISGAALLALKEISDTIDNKDKYAILRKLGTSKQDVNKSLFKQMLIFFGFPLILAIVHSVFGIQVCNFMLGIYKSNSILASLIATSLMIVVIYGGYFVISYMSCKRIIK